MATPSTDQDPATGEVEKHLPPRPSQPRRTGRTRAPVSTPRPDNWADMSQVQRKSWLRKQRIRSNSSRRLRVLLGRDGSVDEASTSPAAAAATGSSLATVPGPGTHPILQRNVSAPVKLQHTKVVRPLPEPPSYDELPSRMDRMNRRRRARGSNAAGAGAGAGAAAAVAPTPGGIQGDLRLRRPAEAATSATTRSGSGDTPVSTMNGPPATPPMLHRSVTQPLPGAHRDVLEPSVPSDNIGRSVLSAVPAQVRVLSPAQRLQQLYYRGSVARIAGIAAFACTIGLMFSVCLVYPSQIGDLADMDDKMHPHCRVTQQPLPLIVAALVLWRVLVVAVTGALAKATLGTPFRQSTGLAAWLAWRTWVPGASPLTAAAQATATASLATQQQPPAAPTPWWMRVLHVGMRLKSMWTTMTPAFTDGAVFVFCATASSALLAGSAALA